MNLTSIRAEMENEQTWRQDEIRFLRNQLANISRNAQKKQYRKSLVVMLYAHYEGFCKFALEQYIRAINLANVKCEEATPAVVAGAWAKVFTAIESGDQKSKVFKTQLPKDDRLHRFARRREFIEQIRDFAEQQALIPDGTVDTESNLWPIVLQKNLFMLGLDHEAFSHHDGDIHRLMKHRNNIAHGAQREGLTDKTYRDLQQAVFGIMDDLMDMVMDALKNEQYKHHAAVGAT